MMLHTNIASREEEEVEEEEKEEKEEEEEEKEEEDLLTSRGVRIIAPIPKKVSLTRSLRVTLLTRSLGDSV